MKFPFFSNESNTKLTPKTAKKKTPKTSSLQNIKEQIEKSIPTVKSVIAKTSLLVGGIIWGAFYSQLDAKSSLNGAITDSLATVGITSTSSQIHALEEANKDKTRKILVHEKIQSSLQEIIDIRTTGLNTCVASLSETTNDLLVAQSRINELASKTYTYTPPAINNKIDSLAWVKSLMKNVEEDLSYPEFKLVIKYDPAGKAIIRANYKGKNSSVSYPTGNISKDKLNTWSQEQYFFFMDQERIEK